MKQTLQQFEEKKIRGKWDFPSFPYKYVYKMYAALFHRRPA